MAVIDVGDKRQEQFQKFGFGEASIKLFGDGVELRIQLFFGCVPVKTGVPFLESIPQDFEILYQFLFCKAFLWIIRFTLVFLGSERQGPNTHKANDAHNFIECPFFAHLKDFLLHFLGRNIN